MDPAGNVWQCNTMGGLWLIEKAIEKGRVHDDVWSPHAVILLAGVSFGKQDGVVYL